MEENCFKGREQFVALLSVEQMDEDSGHGAHCPRPTVTVPTVTAIDAVCSNQSTSLVHILCQYWVFMVQIQIQIEWSFLEMLHLRKKNTSAVN